MREYALVEAMIEKVEREARACNALAVRRVRVRIGRLSGVEERLFVAAFEAMRAGTVCRRAELDLVREEEEWLCAGCGHVLPAEGALTCPKCDWPVHHVASADLELELIDMDVPSKRGG